MNIDLISLVNSRIYNQYGDKPKAVQWYQITPNLGQELADVYEKISTSYDIDSNEGAQLDVIGRLVGISRDFIGNIPLTVYECGDESAECGNQAAQCSPISVEADEQLSDQYFRLLLKSKVAKNTSDATIDSIIQSTQIIVGTDRVVRLQDNEDMTFSIEIYDGLEPIERFLLTRGIIPKPQGVRLRGILDGIGITECDNDLKQCGDESAECVGFIEV